MEEKKLRFCFYCGSLLPPYKKGEPKYCAYCGVKLPYTKKHHIETISD